MRASGTTIIALLLLPAMAGAQGVPRPGGTPLTPPLPGPETGASLVNTQLTPQGTVDFERLAARVRAGALGDSVTSMTFDLTWKGQASDGAVELVLLRPNGGRTEVMLARPQAPLNTRPRYFGYLAHSSLSSDESDRLVKLLDEGFQANPWTVREMTGMALTPPGLMHRRFTGLVGFWFLVLSAAASLGFVLFSKHPP